MTSVISETVVSISTNKAWMEGCMLCMNPLDFLHFTLEIVSPVICRWTKLDASIFLCVLTFGIPDRALDTTQWCRCSETFSLYPEKTSQYQSDWLGFWCFTITVRPGSSSMSREDPVFCPMTAGMSFSWGSNTEPCYYEGTMLTTANCHAKQTLFKLTWSVTPVSVLDSRIMHNLPWLCVLQYVQSMALVKTCCSPDPCTIS